MLLGIADPAGQLAKPVDRAAIPVPQRFASRRGRCRSVARSGSMAVRQASSSPVGRGPSGANRSSGVADHAGRPVDHVEHQVIEIGDLVHRLGDRKPDRRRRWPRSCSDVMAIASSRSGWL